MMLVN